VLLQAASCAPRLGLAAVALGGALLAGRPNALGLALLPLHDRLAAARVFVAPAPAGGAAPGADAGATGGSRPTAALGGRGGVLAPSAAASVRLDVPGGQPAALVALGGDGGEPAEAQLCTLALGAAAAQARALALVTLRVPHCRSRKTSRRGFVSAAASGAPLRDYPFWRPAPHLCAPRVWRRRGPRLPARQRPAGAPARERKGVCAGARRRLGGGGHRGRHRQPASVGGRARVAPVAARAHRRAPARALRAPPRCCLAPVAAGR